MKLRLLHLLRCFTDTETRSDCQIVNGAQTYEILSLTTSLGALKAAFTDWQPSETN